MAGDPWIATPAGRPGATASAGGPIARVEIVIEVRAAATGAPISRGVVPRRIGDRRRGCR